MESKPIFICDFNNCEKIFTTKYSLHRHSLTHNVKKAHVCKQCDKKFTIKQNLIEHEFVHTGELPYACNIDGCAERFRQRGKLSLHRQSHKSYQKKSYKSHVKINDTEDKPLTKIEVSDERMNQPSRLQSVGTSYITTTSEGCRNMSYQQNCGYRKYPQHSYSNTMVRFSHDMTNRSLQVVRGSLAPLNIISNNVAGAVGQVRTLPKLSVVMMPNNQFGCSFN
jgi:uncharacterized Zn-finger protein